MAFLLHLLVLVAIYVVLAVSCDLLLGHLGLLSLAQAAFFSLGAYTSAILTRQYDLEFLPAVGVAVLLSAVASLIISLPSLRLRDDFFVISTFAVQMIGFGVLNNWINLTGGPLGISGIPRPVMFGIQVKSQVSFLVLVGTLVLLSLFLAARLTSGPFGRVLHGIREDEIFVRSLGKNTVRYKVMVFAISASLATAAGSIYAHYVTFVDPSSFTIMESILIVSMVVVGGAASRWGPALGAMILICLPAILRSVGLPNAIAANVRQVVYGILLVLVIAFRPRGLMGNYSFDR